MFWILVLNIFVVISDDKKNIKETKMIGKTPSYSYPTEWFPFTPTIMTESTVTKFVAIHGIIKFSAPKMTLTSTSKTPLIIIPTKFKDFKKSKEYKRLLRRTNRGTHWLPPKPTW